MQHTCADLLDAVKASENGYSDYRMAKLLDIHQSEISAFRHERRFPSILQITQISEWANEDPAKWVFAIEARRLRRLKTATVAAPLERLAANYS